jgi:hypothetical protein
MKMRSPRELSLYCPESKAELVSPRLAAISAKTLR